MLDTTFNPPLPIALKLGDVNLDGFPDLLAITVTGRDQTPHLIYSVPCETNLVGCAKDGSGRRGWKLATKGVKTLEDVKDARSVTFLDMDEDVGFLLSITQFMNLTFCQGTLDIMVQRSGQAGQGNFLFIQNNFYYDAFFLKAIGSLTSSFFPLIFLILSLILVLNGACGNGWCYGANGSERYHVSNCLVSHSAPC